MNDIAMLHPDPKQKPAHEVRLGRVKATLWANAGEHGAFYNVTVTRHYGRRRRRM